MAFLCFGHSVYCGMEWFYSIFVLSHGARDTPGEMGEIGELTLPASPHAGHTPREMSEMSEITLSALPPPPLRGSPPEVFEFFEEVSLSAAAGL